MFRARVPALIAVVLCASPALAGQPAADLSSASTEDLRPVPPSPADAPLGVVYGEVTTGFEATAALMDGWGEFCTGTLIAPRVVLTAAHCLVDAPPSTVYFGDRPGFGGTEIDVAGIRVNADYDAWATRNASDLGLVFLAQDAGVAPVPFDRSDAWALVGTQILYVGFGETQGTGGEGYKKEANATVIDIDGDVLVVRPEDGSACYGDSGGPLYRQLPNGSWTVSGIVSFGYTDDCMDLGGNTRTDVYAGWIDNAMQMGPDGGAVADNGGSDTGWDTGSWDTGAWDTGWYGPEGLGCDTAPLVPGRAWLAALLLAPLARRRTR